MKRGMFLFLIVASLFFSVPSLLAIGISPASTAIAFEPNLHKEFTIYLINSAEKPLNATLQLGGDLAPYLKAEDGFFVISPQSNKAYHIVMDLPTLIKKPGNHIISINALQGPLNTGKEIKGIGAVVSVQGIIVVEVPYPGKYAEAELEITDVNEGESSAAIIRLVNYGLDDIRQAKATLDVYTGDGTLIDTLTSPTISVPSRQSDTFTLSLDSSKYGPGIFPVTSFVEYDLLRTDPISKELRIGTLFANITNYTQEFFTNKIALFDTHIQNRWNDKLENVYAEIKFFKNGAPLDQILRTPSFEIQPWQQVTASAFFDTTNLEPGNYEAEITAYYHGKTTVLRGPLTLKKQPHISLTVVLVGVIVLMLLVDLLVWVLHKRRQEDA